MSTAPQICVKSPGETVSARIDCYGPMAEGETVDTVTGIVQLEYTETDGSTSATSDLTISNIGKNAVTLEASNYARAKPNEAIVFTIAGGVSGKTYKLTATFETSRGQTLEGVCFLRVA